MALFHPALTQGLTFFLLYSFLGWVWESSLLSVREHRWVNRGLLTGPLLPLYGFGALAILLFTLPAAQSAARVFLLGAAGATALEYITGFSMERLFGVRYWDYSRARFNLHGHICAAATVCWGVFSVLLVRVIHPPVRALTARIPAGAASAAALTLLLFAVCDAAFAVRKALRAPGRGQRHARAFPARIAAVLVPANPCVRAGRRTPRRAGGDFLPPAFCCAGPARESAALLCS